MYRLILVGLIFFGGFENIFAENLFTPSSRELSFLFGFPVGGLISLKDDNTLVTGAPVSGFFGLGVDYELRTRRGLGYGGYFRYYTTADRIAQIREALNVMALGGFVRAYLKQNDFDFYISPGFGIASGEIQVGSAIGKLGFLFTPSVALGFLFHISEVYSVGFENLKIIALSGDVGGTVVDDFMIKGNMTF